MDNKEYITFLLGQEMYPKSIRYGISGGELVDYIVGFNCCLNLNTTVVKIGEKSVLLKIQYFEYEQELRVYCHLGVSPQEFYDRVNTKIWDHFLSAENHENFNTQLKSHYDGEIAKLFVKVEGEIKKQLSE